VSIATSADGTGIAFTTYGEGPVVVVVGGATNTQDAWAELGQALATDGFTAVTYDRRGRGASGDTRPYAVEREIEDLVAVIGAVTDGPAGVHAVSSGGALAYRAAAAGAPIRTLSVFEAPYRVPGAPTPPDDYEAHLRELYDADDREAMLAYFMTAGVGQPAEVVEQMRGADFWPALVALGQTTYYDALCLDGSRLPTALWAGLDVPLLSLGSTGSPPWLQDAASAAADGVPGARLELLPGDFHSAPTHVLAPVLAAFHSDQ
jgi:hypothetical protein